jgi:putative transposase
MREPGVRSGYSQDVYSQLTSPLKVRQNGIRLSGFDSPSYWRRGTPISITVDHGSEFTSKALYELAYRVAAKLDFTPPGKPERPWDQCRNVNQFMSLEDAQK